MSIILTSIKFSIPLQDKVDILKFVGAAYLLRDKKDEDYANVVLFGTGNDYWYEAMALRSELTNTIQMVPNKFPKLATNVGSEFSTMEELKYVEWAVNAMNCFL